MNGKRAWDPQEPSDRMPSEGFEVATGFDEGKKPGSIDESAAALGITRGASEALGKPGELKNIYKKPSLHLGTD